MLEILGQDQSGCLQQLMKSQDLFPTWSGSKMIVWCDVTKTIRGGGVNLLAVRVLQKKETLKT